MGRLYVERYISAAEKQHVAEMAEVVRAQFQLSIQNLEWMTAGTKHAALEKLAKIDIKIGFPDAWRSYEAVVIEPDDLVSNLMRIKGAAYQRSIDSLGKPTDRSAWQTPAYASGAYYYRVMNEVVIPAGVLLRRGMSERRPGQKLRRYRFADRSRF